ncbi:DHA2 family efflux MFS transporter permease subunit [Ferrovibrio sp. MS7]|uniref:DHA2 family efflux MFS transporter permease subunit n=1 Tax=Ferrovibrio plantarum TaxID=3119164 RepID=UPI0031350B4E
MGRAVAASAPPQKQAAGLAAITACVMAATVMQALDVTIANVALPYMQGSLSASLTQINWVLTSYIVAAAIMTPPTGWLTARFGRKPVFLFAVAGFTIASVLCGLATSLEQMVLFRLLQGVFGAPLVPLSQAVLLDSYPRERHGYAMALWGMGVMIGPILGPTLGGWLTDNFSWHWVFLINLPVGVLTFLGLSAVMPATPPDPGKRLDWFGFATMSLAIGALQLMLDRSEQLDWFSSPEIVIEAALSLLGAYLFVVHILTARNPFIEPAIFRDRNLVTGLLFIAVAAGIMVTTLALLVPFAQSLLGYPALTVGTVMMPRGIGTMVSMMLVGRIIHRVDMRLLLFIGLSLTALSLHGMSGFTLNSGMADIISTGLLQGFGLGMIFIPLSTLSFSTLPAEHRPQGTALYSLLRNIGSSILVSTTVFVLSSNQSLLQADLVQHVTPFSDIVRWLPEMWNPATDTGRAALAAEVTRQTMLIAYNDCFRLLMLIAVASMPAVLLIRQPR